MKDGKKVVSCFGSSKGKEGEPGYDAMIKVGILLADHGVVVATGGYGGTGMEAPMKGAIRAGGNTIAYTMLGMPANNFASVTIDCQRLSEESPIQPPEVQYGLRLGRLLSADAFIIAADGGPGTMVELMAFINLNSKIWQHKKRCAILNLHGVGCWNNSMLRQLIDWGVLPLEVRDKIIIAETSQVAVNWVLG